MHTHLFSLPKSKKLIIDWMSDDRRRSATIEFHLTLDLVK